jgi:RNA polymerase subunit RPABC4/transcription elongation factor Spt4
MMVLDLDEDGLGMGFTVCSNCGEFILKQQSTCPHCNFEITKKVIESENTDIQPPKANEDSLFICSNCGAFIGLDATHCSACGEKRAPLTAEIDINLEDRDTADKYIETAPELFLCANCGAFMGHTTNSCEICGMNILEDEEDEYIDDFEEEEAAEEIMSDPMETLNKSVILCPKCGSFVRNDSIGCGKCGTAIDAIMDLQRTDDEEMLDADSLLSSTGTIFICKECGAFLGQDAKACTICGSDVAKDSVEEKELEVEEKVPKEKEEDSWANVIIKNMEKELLAPFETSDVKSTKRGRKVPVDKHPKKTKAEVISDCKRLWRKKATALRKLGKYRDALRSLNNVLALDANNRGILLEKADIYYELGSYKQAAKIFTSLLEDEPKSALLWNKLGNSLLRMGNQKESLMFYEKALTLDADNREAIVNKGYVLMKQKKYDEAVKCADMILV